MERCIMDKETKKILAELCREVAAYIQLRVTEDGRQVNARDAVRSSVDALLGEPLKDVEKIEIEGIPQPIPVVKDPDEAKRVFDEMKQSIDAIFQGRREDKQKMRAASARVAELLSRLADQLSD
jgi:uncharacterized pyridoxal phosphate-containing UPF0001 family protein